MKSFALFVLLATMSCVLVTIPDTEGQLGFRFPHTTGRSLNNVSIDQISSFKILELVL